MKYIFFLLSLLILFGCSAPYSQSYDNYDEFDKVNLRNKSWFPDIVTNDAYELKCDSYLDELCAFGTYKCSDDQLTDSIFLKKEHINFSVFKEKVEIHKERIPRLFFLDINEAPGNNYETIRDARFYIVRSINSKQIFFVLSN